MFTLKSTCYRYPTCGLCRRAGRHAGVSHWAAWPQLSPLLSTVGRKVSPEVSRAPNKLSPSQRWLRIHKLRSSVTDWTSAWTDVSPGSFPTPEMWPLAQWETLITCKSCELEAWSLEIIKMTKLISSIPPLGRPILYIFGLCFVSLFLIYSMDVSPMSYLSRDIIDKVKYGDVKLMSSR